jgi:hypothetical protein
MRKKCLIVGDLNPYEVLDGGIERLLIDYQTHVFLSTTSITWSMNPKARLSYSITANLCPERLRLNNC